MEETRGGGVERSEKRDHKSLTGATETSRVHELFGEDGGSRQPFVSVAMIHATGIVRHLHQHPAVSRVCCAHL